VTAVSNTITTDFVPFKMHLTYMQPTARERRATFWRSDYLALGAFCNEFAVDPYFIKISLTSCHLQNEEEKAKDG
jgi:hypothetical protein